MDYDQTSQLLENIQYQNLDLELKFHWICSKL